MRRLICFIFEQDLIDRHFDLPCLLANWAPRGFCAFAVMCMTDVDVVQCGVEMYRYNMYAVSGLACSRCTVYGIPRVFLRVEMILFAFRRAFYYLNIV
jgi:hypothetical protein